LEALNTKLEEINLEIEGINKENVTKKEEI